MISASPTKYNVNLYTVFNDLEDAASEDVQYMTINY